MHHTRSGPRIRLFGGHHDHPEGMWKLHGGRGFSGEIVIHHHDSALAGGGLKNRINNGVPMRAAMRDDAGPWRVAILRIPEPMFITYAQGINISAIRHGKREVSEFAFKIIRFITDDVTIH